MSNIRNLDKLQNKIDKLNKLILDDALEEACILVENDAKRLCPVDTGQLRSSITHEIEDNIGVVGTNVMYAPYIEYGTGLFSSLGTGRQERWSYQDAKGEWHSTIGQRPQPFLHPALEQNRKKVKEFIQMAIESEVKK